MEKLQPSDISKLLTAEVLNQAFKQKTESHEDVKSIQVTRASAAGEGLLSAVYRLHLSGEKHTATFVVKGLVHDMLLRKTLNCERYFKREARFFAEILPVLVQTQKSLGAKERLQRNVPVCYAAHYDGENDYILLEDMIASGCRGLSEDLNLEERDETLRTLAHLHAVSIALRIKNPEIFTQIAESLEEVYYRDDMREFYANYLNYAIEIDRIVIAEYEDPKTSIYYKKFMDLVSNDVYGQLIYLTSANTQNLALNHGDAWCPNFMIAPGRSVAIDFQIYRCTSPAIDLSYFIMICSHLCRSNKDFEKAVTVYYDALSYFLRDMSLDSQTVFSFDALREELKRVGRFGILACLTSIPLRTSADRCDVLESAIDKYSGLETIPLEDLWRLKPMTDERHKMRLVNILRVAVDSGLI